MYTSLFSLLFSQPHVSASGWVGQTEQWEQKHSDSGREEAEEEEATHSAIKQKKEEKSIDAALHRNQMSHMRTTNPTMPPYTSQASSWFRRTICRMVVLETPMDSIAVASFSPVPLMRAV